MTDTLTAQPPAAPAPSTVMTGAAAAIHAEIARQGLTQKQLAARLDWSPARLRAGLARLDAPPRLATLETMLASLGLRARVVVEPLPAEPGT